MSDATNPAPTAEPPDRDPATIARLLARDPDGLRQLFEDHGGIVRSRLRQAFGKVLDDSETDEIMNVTAVRVWQVADRVDPTLGTLRAWVSVIARNCALRFLEARRQYRQVERHADIDKIAEPPLESSPPSLEQQVLQTDLLDCLRNLPPLQREILLADLEAGAPARGDQLAQRLRTSINSIYVSRLKGRRSVRQALEDLGHRPGPTSKGTDSTAQGEQG